MARYLTPDDLRELDSAGLDNLTRWRRDEYTRAVDVLQRTERALHEATAEHDRRGACPTTPEEGK